MLNTGREGEGRRMKEGEREMREEGGGKEREEGVTAHLVSIFFV